MRKTSLILAMFALIAGCNSVDSGVVDTDGMYADMQAIADSTGNTEVTAWLKLGASSLDFVQLTEGDKLTAFMMAATATTETEKAMQEGSFGGATWYSATYTENRVDTQFRIEFDRAGSGKVSAPDSYTTLPAPFVLDTVVGTSQTVSNGTTSFSRADSNPLYVRWNPSTFAAGDVLSYEIAGGCVQTESGTIDWTEVPTTNSFQIAQSYLVSTDVVNNPNCDVTVTISLSRLGAVDAAFESGTFVGVQERVKTYSTTP